MLSLDIEIIQSPWKRSSFSWLFFRCPIPIPAMKPKPSFVKLTHLNQNFPIQHPNWWNCVQGHRDRGIHYPNWWNYIRDTGIGEYNIQTDWIVFMGTGRRDQNGIQCLRHLHIHTNIWRSRKVLTLQCFPFFYNKWMGA